MKRDWIRITFIGMIVPLLAACNQVSVPALPDETFPQPATTPLIDDVPTQESQMNDTQITQPAIPSMMETQIERAKTDLAQRLSITATDIDLVEARNVTWPDTSLGCSQEGMMYAQVETDGFIVRLEANDNLYVYHTDTRGNVVLCETSQLPVFPIKPGEIDDGEPWMPN